MKIKENGFYTYGEMIEAVNELKNEYPSYVKVDSIGTSTEGRDLPLLIITAPGTHDEAKPGYYIQANVHSNEGEGTTVSLYLADLLCSDSKYKGLLEDIIFHIVPRVNPDGAEKAIVERYVVRSREIVKEAVNHIIPRDDRLKGAPY